MCSGNNGSSLIAKARSLSLSFFPFVIYLIKSNKQHPNVHNEIFMERRILCERITATKNTHHPFIVQMHAAFDDYEHIYYCMDLHVVCGDLWSRLKHSTQNNNNKMVGCHRSQAKRWLYQLVDAIEHMHKHGIVHRDLKPENILLDANNHVIVIDFGTAKDLIFTNLNGPEFVGTPGMYCTCTVLHGIALQ
jgi:serine/threonine protein kinase